MLSMFFLSPNPELSLSSEVLSKATKHCSILPNPSVLVTATFILQPKLHCSSMLFLFMYTGPSIQGLFGEPLTRILPAAAQKK